jgi:hypothetical protein
MGGTLEDRPRYNKTRCLETFPFPETSSEQAGAITQLAEKLDNHRKKQLEQHPDLTLTGMYNVLERERTEEPLTAKDRAIHEQGLVSVLKELHDELDRAVFDVYGWGDLGDVLVGRPGATTPQSDKSSEQAEAEEELLSRLVDLNAERAAEEAQGHVRWLRPDYQAPEAEQTTVAKEKITDGTTEVASEPSKKPTWPKSMPDQVEAVRRLLAVGPQSADVLAGHFKRKPTKSINQVLAALQVLGQAEQDGELWRLV